MPYGTVKVDNITFDNGGADQNVTASGIYRAITSGVAVSGVISGATLIGNFTVSGATVTGNTVQGTTVQGVSGTFTSLTGTTTTGTTANFVSGVFTTRVSGATITGTTAQFTSGTFVSLTGTTITGTTISGTTVSSTTGTFTSLTGTTITGTTVNGTTVNSVTGNFTSLTGVTVTGTTANFVSGVFTTQVSGLTVTGTQASFTSGNFVTLSGATATFTSGVIASGLPTAPSLSILGDPNTGIFSPGTDQVAISTSGTGRLFVDANGNVGVGTSSPASLIHVDSGIITTGRYGSSGAIVLRSAAGTQGAPTAISTSTNTSAIACRGYDGSAYRDIASIAVNSDGAISSVSSPGYITFNITSSGSTTVTERARLTSDGRLGLGTSSPLGFLHIESLATTAGWQLRLDSVGLANESGFYRTAADNYEMVLRNGLGGLSYVTNTGGASTATLEFNVQGSERARIDSSGRLLVGTSTALASAFGTVSPRLQIATTTSGPISFFSYANDAFAARLDLSKSRGTTVGTNTVVADGDDLGDIYFNGADGTNFIPAGLIRCEVDGTPGANDMPGRLVMSVTLDGASSPTEALRITNDRVVAYNQPAPTSKSAAATLTITELKTGIIEYTGAVATLTLPTGTLMEGGFSGIYTNMAFEWSVINTGTGICTIGAGTAHTIVGSATVAIGASARFVSRRTASNTFVSYRLS